MHIRHCEQSEAIRHFGPQVLDRFVASAPLRKHFALVAGNDDRWRVAR